MQNNEDPIDELLRRKLNERVFEPGETDWAQAEKLLDEVMPVKRTKRRGAWWYFLSLSITLVVGYLLTKPEIDKENKGATSAVSADIKPNTENVGSNIGANDLSDGSGNQNNLSLKDEKNEGGNAMTEIPSSILANKAKAKRSMRHPELNSSKADLSLPGKLSTYLPANSKQSEASVPDVLKQKSSSGIDLNLAEAINPPGDGTKPKDTSVVAMATEDSTLKVVARNEDSSIVNNPETDSDGRKKMETNKWVIAVNGGSALWKGYHKDVRDSIKNNSNVDFYAGITFQYRASEKLSLSTGLTYMQHSSIYQVNQFSQTRYGLSSEVETYRLITNKLFFLQMPVEAVLSIGSAHRLSAGLAFDLVLDSKNTLAYSYQNNLSSMHTTKENNSSGYRKGISDYGYAMLLGYRVQLTSLLSLSLTAQLGLRDMTRNEYYHKAYRDKNSGLRIGVIYSLYKF